MNVSCSVRSPAPFKRKQNILSHNPFLGFVKTIPSTGLIQNIALWTLTYGQTDKRITGACANVQVVLVNRIAKMLKHFSPHVFVLIHNRIRLRRERYSEGPLVFAKGGQTGVFSSFFSKHFILVFGFVFLLTVHLFSHPFRRGPFRKV